MSRTAFRSAWAARPRAAAAATRTVGAAALLGLVLGASLALAPAAAASTRPVTLPPAHQVASTGELRVVLDDVEPEVARVGEPVTLRGRVVNDTEVQHRVSTVTARAAWVPLTSRAQVTQWVDGTDDREPVWELGDDLVGPVVAPGSDVPFTIEIDGDSLALVPGDLLSLGLELEAAGEDGDVAALRTSLTAARVDQVVTPLELSWVVPLTLPAQPALASPEEDIRHEAWLAAVGPTSPARTWLDHLTLPAVTWLVDPALLHPLDPAPDVRPRDTEPDDQPVQTAEPPAATENPVPAPPPTDREQATTGPGPQTTASTAAPTEAATETTPAPEPVENETSRVSAADVEGSQVALRRLLSRVADAQLWWTPPADPDLALLLAQQVSAPTTRKIMNLPLPEPSAQLDRLLRRGREDVAWAALSAPTTADVTGLQRLWSTRAADGAGLSAVVVPRESLTGGSNTAVGTAAARLSGIEEITALGADSRAAALLARADEDAARLGAGAVAQRLIADNLTAYLQQPDQERSLVYAPPRGTAVPADVLRELTQGLSGAPWARPVAAADLLEAAQGAAPVALSGAGPDPAVLGPDLVEAITPAPSPLDARLTRSLVRLDADLAGLGQVIVDARSVQSWTPVLSHLWATRWRGEPAAWDEAWDELRRPVHETREGVHVNASTINFLSDEGVMQVTVINELPVEVQGVRVQLEPSSNILRVVEQPEPISIGAESRATVSFTAQAVTRGETGVSARLTAPNGTVLGDDTVVNVRVQPTGVWIYWVLGLGAGLLLLLGLSRARGTRSRAEVVAEAEEEGS